MSARKIFLALLATLVIGGRAAHAQPPPPPPPPPPPTAGRDPCENRVEPTGIGKIRGSVVSAETGGPLRNAQLRLTGGGMCANRTTGTDEKGQFEFENLPAGRFTLNAAKPGYVSLEYGQRRPFETGRPIDLKPAQLLEGTNLALPRGGVIVARVVDELGEPVSGLTFQVERLGFSQGQRRLQPAFGSSFDFSNRSDDRGEARVYGLMPGEYFVSIAGSSPLNMILGSSDQGRSYLRTYYPGTASFAQAERVAVQAGKEVSITIPLAIGRLMRISGVLRASDGSVPRAAPLAFTQSTPTLSVNRMITSQPDGSFTIPDLAPGEYALRASIPPGGSPSGNLEVAFVPLTLTTDDVTGLVITTGRGGALRGRFVYDTPPPAGFRAEQLRLTLAAPIVPSETVTFGVTPTGTGATFRPDSTFELTGLLTKGLPRLPPASGWYLKAVLIDGRDAADTILDFTDGKEINDVQVVVTQKTAEIGGTATDRTGAALDYTVVVFPEDRAQWLGTSRFIAAARPDQQGRFKVTGLLAGRYLVAAVEYLETGSQYDPELLGRLRETAAPVVVGEGDTQEVRLRVTGN